MSASNYGAFYGMGDEGGGEPKGEPGGGKVEETKPPSGGDGDDAVAPPLSRVKLTHF